MAAGAGALVAGAVNWNVVGVAAEVPPALPPSAPLLRGARGVAARSWVFPPTRNDKVNENEYNLERH